MATGDLQRPTLTELVAHQFDLGMAPALPLQGHANPLPVALGELLGRARGALGAALGVVRGKEAVRWTQRP